MAAFAPAAHTGSAEWPHTKALQHASHKLGSNHAENSGSSPGQGSFGGFEMKKIFAVAALFALYAVMPARADQSKNEVQTRLDAATATLHELSATPDKGIPGEVYKSAKCIAVVPHLVKGAFIFGGKHGRGLATCRTPDGGWSAPALFNISGGSWGLQVGAESIDLVMMIMTEEGAKHLLENKFQVGANASGAAGTVGRHASAGVDWKLDTQILTYSRSKGLFAGIDLDGSWISTTPI